MVYIYDHISSYIYTRPGCRINMNSKKCCSLSSLQFCEASPSQVQEVLGTPKRSEPLVQREDVTPASTSVATTLSPPESNGRPLKDGVVEAKDTIDETVSSIEFMIYAYAT